MPSKKYEGNRDLGFSYTVRQPQRNRHAPAPRGMESKDGDGSYRRSLRDVR